MLDSVQDLSQQLQNITLEEIVEAEAKAIKLVQKLSSIQEKLDRFDKIRTWMGVAGVAIHTQTENACFEFMPERGAKTHDQTASHPSNLILFPVPHRSSKERPAIFPWTATPLSPETIHLPGPCEAGSVRSAPPEAQPESKFCKGTTDETVGSAAEEMRQSADIPPVMEPTRESAPRTESRSESPEPWIPLPAAEPNSTFEEKMAVGDASEPVRRGLETSFVLADRSAEAGAIDPELELNATLEAPEFSPTRKSQVEFDQRLLDDLIKDYGEFISYTNLKATEEPSIISPSEAQIAITPEVIEKARTEEKATDRALARHRADGDLDRQLKKLIKDYGEYDLYPRQSNDNLKRGVIAAFLLLGVILTGLYLGFSQQVVNLPVNAAVAEDESILHKPAVQRGADSLGVFSDAIADTRESSATESPTPSETNP